MCKPSTRCKQKPISVVNNLSEIKDYVTLIEEDNAKLLQFVRMAACPMRPDGTYNRCREALEAEAKKLLVELDEQ
jgi:hypothetical protein